MNNKIKTLGLAVVILPVSLLSTNCKSTKTETATTQLTTSTSAVSTKNNLAEINAKADNHWLKTYDFDAANFKQPAINFAPFTRWWWPGNAVDKTELIREVNLLADNGFGGVEIQPFIRGMQLNFKPEDSEKVFSWDTPAYYENVRAVLEQAKQRGLTVDMSDGSGWSTGGPHLTAEDNFLTINHAAIDVEGGKKIQLEVPKASMEHKGPPAGTTSLANLTLKYGKVDPSLAKLQRVIAAKVVKNGTLSSEKTVQLDPKTVVDLTQKVKDNQLTWDAPAGEWKLIAFWTFPSGEMPKWIAKADKGYVPNHFDSTKVNKNYEHLLGKRTGLEPYYGNPLRSIFNDSYEFQVDRHYAMDLFDTFKKNRGYDISTLMPANVQPGYDNHAEQGIYPNEKPYFAFSEEDWRLRYDYNLTLSDLLQTHFFDISRSWLGSRNMLHRTQPYGLNMDVIGAAGNASIPESEQLWASGSEGFMKVVSSGAHLYNRPINTAEAVVYRHRAEMTTPQKIKISVDKALAAGVNQIIYHGTAYQYTHPDYSKEGWNPFDSPHTPFLTYSSSIKEKDNFWKHMKEMNQYIGRAQYAMQSGKPKADVLIYYPLLGVEGYSLENPKEVLTNGYLPGIEPDADAVYGKNKRPVPKKNQTQDWFNNVWATINQLEAAGISWDLVNDASLQAAKFNNNQIDIRGNKYSALILPNEPYIQIGSAERINEMSKQGAKLLVIGNVPDKQPSHLNYAENDRKTKALLEEAVKQTNGKLLPNETGLNTWIAGLNPKIKFNGNYNFTRQQQREMSDGSRLHFIWNTSDKWQTIALTTDATFKNNYWLDADKGTIVSSGNGNQLPYQLPPYGSVLLYASTSQLNEGLLSKPEPVAFNGKPITTITKWNIKAGDAVASNSPLFDWKTNDKFRYKADEGIYTATVNVNKTNSDRYFLDLGTVYFTAEVLVNGQPAGKRIFAPYELDITNQLKNGQNQIEVRVTPTERNESVAEGIKGNPHYTQYKERGNTLMPGGLIGPVTVKTVKMGL